ncbi:MAG: tryptophan synthase subunit alpha [Dehalococcoidales bacterium]|nr:tryptophan synthase subunit alpha [Dehalococcoidales bacterium]
MGRISEIFNRKGHKALIPYVTTGYPRPETTLEAVPLLAASGADIVELGIPFSDPLADGATIQESSYRALLNGVTPSFCIETASRIREKTEVPLVFMTYYNPVMSYGEDRFCRDCHKSGIDGLIVPDLPPEEGLVLEEASAANGIDLVYLLAPTSTEERIRLVAAKSRGFIYLVSVAGVTGARNSLPAGTEAFIGRVRKYSSLPLCVGFGISSPEQAAQVSKLADGVIVGSRLVQLMKEDQTLSSLQTFTSALRTAIDS